MADSNTESAIDRGTEYIRLLIDDLNQEVERRNQALSKTTSLERGIELTHHEFVELSKVFKTEVFSLLNKIEVNGLWGEIDSFTESDFNGAAEHLVMDCYQSGKITRVFKELAPMVKKISSLRVDERGSLLLKLIEEHKGWKRELDESRERVKHLLGIVIPLREGITAPTDLPDTNSLILLGNEKQEAIDQGQRKIV